MPLVDMTINRETVRVPGPLNERGRDAAARVLAARRTVQDEFTAGTAGQGAGAGLADARQDYDGAVADLWRWATMAASVIYAHGGPRVDRVDVVNAWSSAVTP